MHTGLDPALIQTIEPNVGWNVLISATLKPKNLAKNEAYTVLLKERLKGARYGFVANSIMVIVAIWFPYVAVVLTTIFWGYWVYAGVSTPEETARE